VEPLDEQRPVRHPKALWRAIGDETLLLRLDTGRSSVLNKVGVQVWELLDGERRVSDIVEAIDEIYEVDRGQLADDVAAFIQGLLDREMISLQ
jgi:hypothetical protein